MEDEEPTTVAIEEGSVAASILNTIYNGRTFESWDEVVALTDKLRDELAKSRRFCAPPIMTVLTNISGRIGLNGNPSCGHYISVVVASVWVTIQTTESKGITATP